MLGFHLDLVFPDEVNGKTVCASIDKKCHDFHVAQSDVRLFVHDAATCMTNAIEWLENEKGYTKCVHIAC